MNSMNTVLYIAAIVISVVVGIMVIPQILRLCKKKGLYDLPDERKVHSNAIPRLGGVSFVPALVVSVGCLIGIMNPLAQGFHFDTSLRCRDRSCCRDRASPWRAPCRRPARG